MHPLSTSIPTKEKKELTVFGDFKQSPSNTITASNGRNRVGSQSDIETDNSLLNRTVSTTSSLTSEATELEQLRKQLEEMQLKLNAQEEQLNERERKIEKKEKSLNQQLIKSKSKTTTPKSQKELADEHFERLKKESYALRSSGFETQAILRRMLNNVSFGSHPLTTRLHNTPIAKEAFIEEINGKVSMFLIMNHLKTLYPLGQKEYRVPTCPDFHEKLTVDIMRLMAYWMLYPKFDVQYEGSCLGKLSPAEENFSLRCKDTLKKICRDAKYSLSQKYNYFDPSDVEEYQHNPDAINELLQLINMCLEVQIEILKQQKLLSNEEISDLLTSKGYR